MDKNVKGWSKSYQFCVAANGRVLKNLNNLQVMWRWRIDCMEIAHTNRWEASEPVEQSMIVERVKAAEISSLLTDGDELPIVW